MTNTLMQIKKLPGSAHFNEVQYLIDDYINLCIYKEKMYIVPYCPFF